MGKSQQKCQACGAGRAEEGTSRMIPPMFVTRQPSLDPRSISLRVRMTIFMDGLAMETVASPFLLGCVFGRGRRTAWVLVVGERVERGRGAPLLLGCGVGGRGRRAGA